MKIAIIEYSKVNYFTDNFCRYLKTQKIGHENVLLAQIIQTSFDLHTSTEIGYLIRDSGVVDHDYRRVFLSQLAASSRVYPDRDLILKLETKAQAYYWLKHLQQPTLPFYVLPPRLERSQFENLHTSKEFAESAKFVIKPLRSNQGIGVNIFENKDRLWDFIQTVMFQNNPHWLVQPYIENAREYRLLFLSKQVFKVFEKRLTSAKGNLFQGAEMLEIELNQFNQDTGYDPSHLARQFESYTAIDFLFCDKTRSGFVIDVNLFPGIKILDSNSQRRVFQHIVTSLSVE